MKVKVYIGIKLDWDYVNRTVILSMPNYVCKALHIFQNKFGRQGVLPPFLRPNPIWSEISIRGTFGCVRVPIRQRNQPNTTSL